ncbi:MAG: MATE family efflux transporter [Kofleriaceae bacterium]
MNRQGSRPEPSTSELAQQIRLAIPLALQQLGFHLMGTVDAAWLGRYSDVALAAAGVGNNLLFAITAIGLGIVMGLDTVIPQAIGAGRHEDAQRYLAAGIRLAVVIGMIGTVVVLATPLLLSIAGVDRDVAHDARTYVYLRSLGIVPFLLSIALRSYLAARNVTRPLVLAVIIGNIANAALDVVLIFGIETIGLPPLGVVGAAIATVSVQIVIVVVYAAAVRALDEGAALPRSSRAQITEIVRYGGPVGGQLFAEVAIFGVATMMAARLGTVPGAAHSAALTLVSFTFSVAVGIGAATSVRVGHAIGEGNIALARRRGIYGLGIGLAVMSVFSIALITAPAALARVFTDDAVVVVAIVPLLQIAALFQLSDGTQAIAAGALRGIGQTRATLIGNLVGHYGVGLAISLALAFGAGLGAPGLWWGLSAGLTATALFLVARFLASTRVA